MRKTEFQTLFFNKYSTLIIDIRDLLLDTLVMFPQNKTYGVSWTNECSESCGLGHTQKFGPLYLSSVIVF